jgi:Flp pilus assembly protein TadD
MKCPEINALKFALTIEPPKNILFQPANRAGTGGQMFLRWFNIMSLALALGGCASVSQVSISSEALWQDQFFNYNPSLVAETRESLFAIDPPLAQNLLVADVPGAGLRTRLLALLSQIYGGSNVSLAYASGNTTGAMDTWRNQKGDCLSLTVLAYSAAKSLGIQAQMQDVPIPLTTDRRLGTEFVNGHVNVFIPNRDGFDGRKLSASNGGLVIDFEPYSASYRAGDVLTESEVLARFYNNRGAQLMVQGDHRRAYAYYKASIAADGLYAPTLANLAQLYSLNAKPQIAESILRHAISLSGRSYAPLRNMVDLLQSQGRGPEAKIFSEQLQRREHDDPYHWIALGLDAVRQDKFEAAVQHFERAAAITQGFEEVHSNLALAYLRTGQKDAAQKQLKLLAALNSNSPSLNKLAKKMDKSRDAIGVF